MSDEQNESKPEQETRSGEPGAGNAEPSASKAEAGEVKPDTAGSRPAQGGAKPEQQGSGRPEQGGRKPDQQNRRPEGEKKREDRPAGDRPAGDRPGGGNRAPRENRGDRPGGDRPGGDRGDRRGPDRGDRGRPDLAPDMDIDKLIADSLYLDNQAHVVVSRMRDMDSGTKSQLRRLYNAVRRAVRAPENERQHQFVMLRARLAYTIARHSLRSLDGLERLLLQVTRKNDARGYERFKDLFEAIIAYNE